MHLKQNGSDDTYTQVLLNRNAGSTIIKLVLWVPSKFAKVGNRLNINHYDDWQVIETYSSYAGAHVRKYSKDFKVAKINEV